MRVRENHIGFPFKYRLEERERLSRQGEKRRSRNAPLENSDYSEKAEVDIKEREITNGKRERARLIYTVGGGTPP